LAGDYIVGQFLSKHITEDIPQSITFTSDRQSTTLLINEIMYIESNDTEVWIHATEGRKYRNKTSITSWENLLGHGFIRTHRSFLANRSYCTAAEKDSILIGDERIPISRKYKDSVIHTLQN
jgi:DNA-binding LytR/AlgR family response regulator